MDKKLSAIFSWMLILSLLISACQSIPALGKSVTVSIVYGSEKQAWLEPLVQEYNAAGHKTAEGTVIKVEATPMGSIESVEAILDGTLQPTVWSPASSVYIPVANAEWAKSHTGDLVDASAPDLVLSPVVIAMWEPMARALGWPDKALGWRDIAELATSKDGWEAYGFPAWGAFQFGHTHPEYSNSGLVSVLAEAYAGAGKQRGLTLADINDPAVSQFMAQVESSVIHYGTSTGFFAERMFERGPSYLSAAVLYENLIVAQESKRLAGQSNQTQVVAIYPKEGTFWSNHPYAILNAPWVTAEQRAAADDFQAFLLDKPQQQRAIALGFRPADPSIPLASPLDAQHGVDINQPQSILEVPPVAVIAGIGKLWEQTKKPVDLVVVMDISGSMKGDKISAARESLKQFIRLLDDRDRLEIILFNSEMTVLTDLSPVGEKRENVLANVGGIFERGGTRLYDAVEMAYQELDAKGDPEHIRGIVVLSDGVDTESQTPLPGIMQMLQTGSEESGGNSIKLFTIGFGEDADKQTLVSMAEATGGKQYDASPENIIKIYAEIATFF
ncbi:MAG: VWA domain-containing protein [Chloroflexota bacterium]